jgi:hypothetical protein
MNGIENNHLEPDTIEDAVLGRLTPDDSSRVESHVRVCARCREALEQERLIAAGTRAWGRAAMKQKLAGRIAIASRQRTPWPHILSAAALLVVIIGVGVLFRWRSPDREPGTSFSDSVFSGEPTKDARPAPAPSAVSEESARSQIREQVSPADREISRYDKKGAPRTGAQIPAPGIETAATEELEQPVLEQKAKMKSTAADEVAKAPDLNVWVEGIQWSTPFASGMQAQPAGASNQGVSANRLEARSKVVKHEMAALLVFIINQRPRGELHDTRPVGYASGMNPAHVVRVGDTLYVTLYLDTLLTPERLQSTFGQQATPDSFQIMLPDRILGYRIPGGMTR